MCVCVVDAAPEDAAVSMSLSIPGLEDVSQSLCVTNVCVSFHKSACHNCVLYLCINHVTFVASTISYGTCLLQLD